MILIRSLVFNILFYTYTALMTLLAIGGHLLGRRYTLWMAYTWGIGTHFLLKWIVGLTYEIRGRHHWDGQPAIFACKHQSLLETAMIQVLAFDSCIILKRELLWIPFFGQALSALNVIDIKRSRGRQALEELVAKAKRRLQENYNVLIFPEGTRTAPGQVTKLKYGIAALYQSAHKPVIPIVLNTGYFWPRRSFRRYPGKVIYEYLEPIQPGMSTEAFMHHLTDVMEKGCRALDAETTLSLHEKKKVSWKSLIAILSLVTGALFYTAHHTKGYLIDLLKKAHEQAQAQGFLFDYDHMDVGLEGTSYKIVFHQPSLQATWLSSLRFKSNETWVLRKSIFSLTSQVDFASQGPVSLTTGLDLEGEPFTLKAVQGYWRPHDIYVNFKELEGQDLSINEIVYKTVSQGSHEKHHVSFDTLKTPRLSFPLDKLQLNIAFPEGAPSSPAALQAWSDKGAVMDIEGLEVVMSPFQAFLKGSLSFDETMTPIGSFTLKTQGLDKGLDMLQTNETVPPFVLSMLKLVLKNFKGDTPHSHGLSVTLQNNQLYVEGIPVMTLPSFSFNKVGP